jgi:hypothetical protein
LIFVLGWVLSGEIVVGTTAIGATAVVSASWFGAAFGRLLSMLRDDTRTKFNRFSVAIEVAMFVFVGLPWLLWLLRLDG